MRRVPVEGKRGKRGTVREVAATPDTDQAARDCTCPVLERDEWHEVESDWSDIAFVKSSVSAVLGVPVGYADVRESLRGRARRMGADAPDDAMFLLGSGRFRRRVLLEVDGVGPGARDVVFPGGMIYSRLLEVPWGEMKSAVAATSDVARSRYCRRPDDMFVWYLTCRRCSRQRNFETLIVAHYRRGP